MFLSLAFGLALTVSDAKKDLQSEYDRWAKAVMASDIAVLESILSPKFETRTTDGKHKETRDEFLSFFKGLKSSGPKVSAYKVTINELSFSKGNPVATITEAITFTKPDKSVSKVSLSTRDTWVKAGKHWQILWSVSLGRKKG